jgi:hypothetical protein
MNFLSYKWVCVSFSKKSFIITVPIYFSAIKLCRIKEFLLEGFSQQNS